MAAPSSTTTGMPCSLGVLIHPGGMGLGKLAEADDPNSALITTEEGAERDILFPAHMGNIHPRSQYQISAGMRLAGLRVPGNMLHAFPGILEGPMQNPKEF